MTDKRKVLLRVQFLVEREYPADWTDEQILFHCNESSSCRDNLLTDRLRQSVEGPCTCSDFGYDDEHDVEIVAPETPQPSSGLDNLAGP